MDFTRQTTNTTSAAPAPVSHSPVPVSKNSKRNKGWRWLRYASVALLVSIGLLVAGLTAKIALSSTGASESKYVNTKDLQAVFLNGGQVYFGNITTLNSKFVGLSNIYYLRVNQAVQPTTTTPTTNSSNDVSLVKLGCELHGPEDQMVINQDQVIFWENLKSDGQVAKAVAQFQKQNPNGQNCTTANAVAPTTNK